MDAELGPHNELLVHVKIDDQPETLLLDTGAVSSVMFENAVARLGLSRTSTRSTVFGVDGRPLDEMTSLPSLALGTAVSRGTQFPVSPAASGNAAGLLGADYLRNYDVEIDLADHKVNLFHQDHCPGKVVYWANEYNASDVRVASSGWVTLDVELDGKTVEALLDTGAAMDVLRLGTARGRFGVSADSPGVVAEGNVTGAGGESLSAYGYSFKSLKFGDLTIQNPRMVLAPMRDAQTGIGSHLRLPTMPDMVIGMSLLQHLRLYIAYGERRIYYTVAGAAAKG